MIDSFKRVCDWLEYEADSELYTLSEIYWKLEELVERKSCYMLKYFMNIYK